MAQAFVVNLGHLSRAAGTVDQYHSPLNKWILPPSGEIACRETGLRNCTEILDAAAGDRPS